MGKSCVRFRSLADVPLDVIDETIAKVDLPSLVETHRATACAARADPRGKAGR